jgi:hypothetical protein
MTELDPNKIYGELMSEEIILFYQGKITTSAMDTLYQNAESKFNSAVGRPKTSKKLFLVMVECLQNVYQHGISGPANGGLSLHPDISQSVFMMIKHKDGSFGLITGNYINKEEKESLRSDIEKINSMESGELKKYYLEKLGSTELSPKGGADLGLIDIARKSKNKLEYKFDFIAGSYWFFSLIVKIKA